MKLLILFAFVSAASCLLLDNYNLDKLPTFPGPIIEHPFPDPIPINPVLIKRESGEIFTAHVKDELNHVVDIVKAAAHAAELVKNTLVKGMQTVASKVLNGENDIKEVVHRIVDDVKTVILHMEKNNIFDLDVGKLFESIIPKALSKMLRVHKRGLVLDLLSGLKNTVVDTLGLVTSSFSSLKPFLGNLISSATSQFRPTIDNLKALAHTFLEHAGKTTAAVALQAVKFFAPFKAQIGSLFNQIKQLAAKLTGHS